MGYFIAFLLLLSDFACANQKFGQNFGQYGYINYAALNNQLQYNRARAIQRQKYYNQSPTRNIIIPRGAVGAYPNIERYQRTQAPSQRVYRYY